VLVLSGPTGKRITRWVLNPREPAAPTIGDGEVTFEGRTGRLYFLAPKPAVQTETDPDFRDGKPAVQVLVHECAGEPTAFAFSNASFSFMKNDLSAKGILEFSDESGAYRLDISTIVDARGYMTWGNNTAKVTRLGRAVTIHGPPWEKGKSGAPNEETIRPFELFLHSEPETTDDAGHVFITPNDRSDEYLVPLTCLFPTWRCERTRQAKPNGAAAPASPTR
jgi:hypothetical protein